MPNVITIPARLNLGYGGDHFTSDAIITVAGSTRSGGPGGWAVGGWGERGQGRLVHQGPLVQGPHAYLVGRPGVIDNHGGTRREHKDAKAQGNLFHLEPGDLIEVYGTTYRVELDPRAYPKLVSVD